MPVLFLLLILLEPETQYSLSRKLKSMYSCSVTQTSTNIENIFLVGLQIHRVSTTAENVDWNSLQYFFHHNFVLLFLFLQWQEDNISGTSSLSGALVPGNFPIPSVTK